MAVTKSVRPSSASELGTAEPFPLGSLMARTVSLLSSAFRASGLAPTLVIGGADLSNVDLSQPFYVNFSVGPQASLQEKAQALGRLRRALIEFRKRLPWVQLQADSVVEQGRFVLWCTPVATLVDQGGLMYPFVNESVRTG